MHWICMEFKKKKSSGKVIDGIKKVKNRDQVPKCFEENNLGTKLTNFPLLFKATSEKYYKFLLYNC